MPVSTKSLHLKTAVDVLGKSLSLIETHPELLGSRDAAVAIVDSRTLSAKEAQSVELEGQNLVLRYHQEENLANVCL